jgi:hypothetical protein
MVFLQTYAPHFFVPYDSLKHNNDGHYLKDDPNVVDLASNSHQENSAFQSKFPIE